VLTVYREVDGCSEPLIVRHGYGFGERPKAPVRPRASRW
jgi:hypothetical protein